MTGATVVGANDVGRAALVVSVGDTVVGAWDVGSRVVGTNDSGLILVGE